ncbi:MAG: tetratricopeptide repeat protein [Candidatus Obscuribacterales bacterium]|nr:tetratricopeptide repeat protein [Candidatus Obscuribacterales bacterium]
MPSVPDLVDDELAARLSKRGQIEFSAFRKRRFIIVFALSVLVGMSLTPVFASLFQIPLLLAALIMVSIAGSKTLTVARAFSSRRYDQVAVLLPNTMRINTMWYPLTYFQYRKTLVIQLQLLLMEGRFAELEALIRYYWGATERQRKEFSGTPSNFFVANALAVAYLQQNKFAEAEKIFFDLLEGTRARNARVLLLNNYAYCLIRGKRFAESEKILTEALKLNRHDTKSSAALRLQMLKTRILLSKNEFQAAEDSIEIVMELATRLKEVAEATAFCQYILGEIRTQQHSYEEAKLYFQNAIEIMQSADNPNYVVLLECTNSLGDMLMQSGQVELAQKQYLRGRQIFALYLERENYALDLMRNRLDDPTHTSFGVDLIKLADRIKYLDTIAP